MKYLVRALRHPRDYTWSELRPWQRHSLVLAVAGSVYVAFGAIYLFTEPSPQRTAALRFVLSLAPLWAWGTLWVIVGALAILSARWPPASKTWGYGALSGLAAGWAASHLVGVLLLNAPTTGLTAALVWALVAFLWWAIAGLANPDDLLTLIDDIDHGNNDAEG